MRRRLLISNLLLIAAVLILLEVPLGIVYARHEHDQVTGELQRDAASLGALSEEIIEHPGDHDVAALAQRFSAGVGGQVIIEDRSGAHLTPLTAPADHPTFEGALRTARAGRTISGEDHGLAYAVVAVGAGGDARGAVLVARSDGPVDHRVKRFWLVLAGIGLGVLGVSTVVSRRLARWAVNPLKELDDHAAALGQGHLHVRAQSNAGPTEVVALATTFNEMAARLDELVAAQRRFVADASHQLRTPLTALRLRLDNIDAGDPAAVATARDAALHEVARLTRIVDGLLALARAEGRRDQRELVDLGEVVAERHSAWAPLAAERGIRLDLRVADRDHMSALLVPGHLDQILDNLIDNALEATPSGQAVTLASVAVGSAVEIHVTDTGPGLSDDERRRAFDPFWQSAKSHAAGGSGLGLAIVDQLVRANRGTVVLDSSPSGGVDAVVRFRQAQGDRTLVREPIG